MAFGGGFGSSAFGASSSTFGNPSQPLFGQSSAPFGQSTPPFGAFGQSTPPFGQSASAFGHSTSAFGQSAPAFSQPTPAFGQTASSFGSFRNSQPSLWAQSSSSFASTQPFGSSQLFGASQAAFGAQSQPLFASSQPAFSQSQPFGGQHQFAGGWDRQQQTQQPPSTRSAKYQISQLYDTNSTDPSKFTAITAMDQFQTYSIEELRVADYARGDKSGGAPAGMGSFGPGFNSAGSTGFGAQSGSGFGISGFGGQSQPAFGAQSQSLFGGQSQQSLFGGSSGGAFGASSGGLFGSAPNQGQTGGLFGGSSGGRAFGSTGFGPSGFGQSSGAASGFGGFGSVAQSQSLFGGGQQSGGGLFGTQAQSGSGLFGSQPQSGGSLFSSQPQSGGGLFGSQQQSAGGLFGAQAQSGGGLFGASSSSVGASAAFGAPFGAQQAPQSAPSLFGGSSGAYFGTGGATSTRGLFGGQTGSNLFGNAGSNLFEAASGPSLFGSQAALGASSSSGFGYGFGGGFGAGFGSNNANNWQQYQQQQHGSLEASVTKDPYGHSQLFSSVANQTAVPSSIPPSSLMKTTGSSSQPQGKDIRVVVETKVEPSRRMGGSHTISRQTALFGTGRRDWYNTSPIRHWGPQRPLLDMRTTVAKREPNKTNPILTATWRTEEQKKKAANIRKLVIEPMEGDPILKVAMGHTEGLLCGRGPSRRPASEQLPFPRNSEVETAEDQELSHEESGRPFSAPAGPVISHEENETGKGAEVEGDAETSIDSEVAEENGAENVAETEFENQDQPGAKETPRSYREVENFNSRYVPYKEYYRTQMRRSGRQSTELASGDHTPSPLAPVSSSPGLHTSPSLSDLEKMNAKELSRVESFKIWKRNIGEIEWQEPVDLRGINLDETVRMEPKEVCVYPREEDVPPKGEGMNKPAIIRLHGIWKTDKETGQPRTDASTVAAIVRKLQTHCEEEKLEFVGYEVRTGTWTFKAHSF